MQKRWEELALLIAEDDLATWAAGDAYQACALWDLSGVKVASSHLFVEYDLRGERMSSV